MTAYTFKKKKFLKCWQAHLCPFSNENQQLDELFGYDGVEDLHAGDWEAEPNQ